MLYVSNVTGPLYISVFATIKLFTAVICAVLEMKVSNESQCEQVLNQVN